MAEQKQLQTRLADGSGVVSAAAPALDGLSTIFSHELVEAVTDPDGNAILGDTASCYGGGWCEIGDVCQGNTGQSNGVTVPAYWSQRTGTCVIPS